MLRNRLAVLRWVFPPLVLPLLVLPGLVLPAQAGLPNSQTTLESPKSLPAAMGEVDLTPTENAQLKASLAEHDYNAAERLLLGEIDRDPSSLRASRLLSLIGRVYFLNSDYLNAAIAWKKSEALAPLEPSARFSLAMVYIRLGHGDWARPLLQSLSKEQPHQSLYPYWLGRLDYDVQNYETAILKFRQALVIQPDMARAYDNLGLCYYYQNKTSLAIESYTKAIELDRKSVQPSAWPHLNLAIVFYFLNRIEEAEAQLHEALRLDPNLAPAHFELGLILESGHHFDTAVSALSTAAQLDANYAEPHYALARIYRKQGRKALAQHEVELFQHLRSGKHQPGDHDQ